MRQSSTGTTRSIPGMHVRPHYSETSSQACTPLCLPRPEVEWAPATDTLNNSLWAVLQAWRNSPAVLPSKPRDSIQSRIQSGVKHRAGSALH